MRWIRALRIIWLCRTVAWCGCRTSTWLSSAVSRPLCTTLPTPARPEWCAQMHSSFPGERPGTPAHPPTQSSAYSQVNPVILHTMCDFFYNERSRFSIFIVRNMTPMICVFPIDAVSRCTDERLSSSEQIQACFPLHSNLIHLYRQLDRYMRLWSWGFLKCCAFTHVSAMLSDVRRLLHCVSVCWQCVRSTALCWRSPVKCMCPRDMQIKLRPCGHALILTTPAALVYSTSSAGVCTLRWDYSVLWSVQKCSEGGLMLISEFVSCAGEMQCSGRALWQVHALFLWICTRSAEVSRCTTVMSSLTPQSAICASMSRVYSNCAFHIWDSQQILLVFLQGSTIRTVWCPGACLKDARDSRWNCQWVEQAKAALSRKFIISMRSLPTLNTQVILNHSSVRRHGRELNAHRKRRASTKFSSLSTCVFMV